MSVSQVISSSARATADSAIGFFATPSLSA